MFQKVFSFDVFDTVIVRVWARPTDLFVQVADELAKAGLITTTQEQWPKIKTNIERELRSKNRTKEIHIDSIYNALALRYNWSSTERELALQIETEIEKKGWNLVPSTKKYIQEIHQSGNNVIYISDMYLPEITIRSFFEEKDLWREGDILYVSSSTGLTKKTGSLFDFCLKEQGLSPKQLNHMGDNVISDVLVPKRSGINTCQYTDTQLTRYEKRIAEHTSLPLKLRSLLSGSCRLNRLNSPYTDPHQLVIWQTASDVMGPVFFSFVYWCIVEAKKRNIERLYFIARDGQILHKIAILICKAWGYKIDCRYLYGSRQAIKFPSIKKLDAYELDWIFQFKEGSLSVDSVCERVNISPLKIRDALVRNGFSQDIWGMELTISERDKLRKIFQDEQEISSLILATVQSYRESALGYFSQEGMLDEISYGFVDLGWTGSVLKALGDLLKGERLQPNKEIQGFYFALKQRVDLPSESLAAYYYDNLNPKFKRLLVCQSSELFEALVAADHGSTVKYEKQNERYIPILRNSEKKEILDWGIHAYQKSILSFSNILLLNVEENLFSSYDSLTISDSLLNLFVKSPSRLESEVFGQLQHSQDMVEAQLFYLAPKLSAKDFLYLLVQGNPFPSYLWINGTDLSSIKQLA
ncbi:HAD family hydrolase [Acaryochloris marina]|uniref:Uncharacterized protein n=1 Tax=Acaryochloris marina (strain MBIC 11017) TaxID=329726 RepID=B0CE47_ACAM1|nr:hypothetical protein [Acaryochloris marina]ABW30521.1 hypothetical protein AM1_5568 [Acaryochloris marina MBIC11017]BDM79325.1 hypothetical protein AM10699_21930 [Acaryochloris marina MBIC10699]